MFTSDDTEHLATLIDAFQVPMFVADAQTARRGRFILRAINEAHSRASTVDAGLARDVAIDALLPPADAKAVNAHYSRCIRKGVPIDYEETLELNGLSTRWHTTLVPTMSDSGRPRIVGNAVLVETRMADPASRKVFEDINYFSAQSQFQLTRVSAYLDVLETRRRDGVNPTDLQVLSALCRTVDRNLQDIRAVAEPRTRDVVDMPRGFLMDSTATASRRAPDPVRRTLQRLTSILAPIH